jgi:uncharacterized protein YpmB
MSQEAIIGMIVCLLITAGGFLYFLWVALKSDKKSKAEAAEAAKASGEL